MKRVLAILPAAALLAALAGCAPAAPEAEPSPSPQPSPAPTLALFGSSHHPWWEALEAAGEDWADQRGWELVSYDCRGYAATQAIQVDELVNAGGADLAVLLPVGDKASQREWIRAMTHLDIPVVTVSDQTDEKVSRYVGCQIGPDEEALTNAAAGFFRDRLGEDQGVLLLLDTNGDPLAATAREALEAAGVSVLEQNYTWNSVDFGANWLSAALERCPQTGAILCASRIGALSAQTALAGRGEDSPVSILALGDSPELLEDLDRGAVAGVLGASGQEAADRLREALTQLSAGRRPGSVTLEAQLRQ